MPVITVSQLPQMGDELSPEFRREPDSPPNRNDPKAKAYNTCRAPQAATATSEALVMSQAKLA